MYIAHSIFHDFANLITNTHYTKKPNFVYVLCQIVIGTSSNYLNINIYKYQSQLTVYEH